MDSCVGGNVYKDVNGGDKGQSGRMEQDSSLGYVYNIIHSFHRPEHIVYKGNSGDPVEKIHIKSRTYQQVFHKMWKTVVRNSCSDFVQVFLWINPADADTFPFRTDT